MTARVLVVDDVELNVKLLEAKLSSEYFEVIVADNGPVALELAETEMPDIILLDVMMPVMDGFEVCRRLKANPRTAMSRWSWSPRCRMSPTGCAGSNPAPTNS